MACTEQFLVLHYNLILHHLFECRTEDVRIVKCSQAAARNFQKFKLRSSGCQTDAWKSESFFMFQKLDHFGPYFIV